MRASSVRAFPADYYALMRRLLACLVVSATVASAHGAAPTPAQALSLAPIQPGVGYAQPAGDEIERCTIKPEKNGNSTAWVVRSANGQTLRRFSDTNRDNVVDVWSYYLDGLEVYRDLDSNFDNKADQYRWFHTSGARWGIDNNQDGTIDSWRAISPHEVAEEVVAAIQRKDEDAFASLLLTGDEIKQLGAGNALQVQLKRSTAEAATKFRELVRRQKSISPGGRFADFGAARPSVIPAGADRSSKDITVYQNVSALVDEGGRTEQVQIGLLVKVGDAWRLVETPQIGDEAVGLTVATSLTASRQADDNPTEKMQTLMAELEKLDQQPPGSTAAARTSAVQQRAKLLRDLAAATPRGGLRDQWFNQLADMLSAAVVEGEYKSAQQELNKLDGEARSMGAGVDAQAHVRFQRLWTDWAVKSQDPKIEYVRLQDDWRKQLQSFTKAFPSSPDTAEALLQLGMVDDLAGRDNDAVKWYERLAKDFDGSPRGQKAAGALRRLRSPGKTIPLRGTSLDGKTLGLENYRGKHVLVQYWATWCEPCKEDMAALKDLVAKYGKKGFVVLGVNLDNERSDAQQFVRGKRLPWRHLHESGGLEGRLANEMGVINLPLMLLVDDKGKVISRNIRADELEAELRRQLR